MRSPGTTSTTSAKASWETWAASTRWASPPGTTIHHNRFHDIERFGYGGWGIYFDEGSTGIVAEDNLVYSTTTTAVFTSTTARSNVFRNNVLYHSREVQFGPTRLDWPAEPGKLRRRKRR